MLARSKEPITRFGSWIALRHLSGMAGDDIESSIPSSAKATSGKKLLVLDINGLLLDTRHVADHGDKVKMRSPDGMANRFAVYQRPFCRDFADFCLQNFVVGVWSSSRMHNIKALLQFVFPDPSQLAFIWDQEKCTNTGYRHPLNSNKPIFLKELSLLWQNDATSGEALSRKQKQLQQNSGLPWSKGQFGPWNTLLLDDSPYKALKNPAFTAIFPPTYEATQLEDSELCKTGSLRRYLEGIKDAADVRAFVQFNPYGLPPLIAASLKEGMKMLAKLSKSVGASEERDAILEGHGGDMDRRELGKEGVEEAALANKRMDVKPKESVGGGKKRERVLEDVAARGGRGERGPEGNLEAREEKDFYQGRGRAVRHEELQHDWDWRKRQRQQEEEHSRCLTSRYGAPTALLENPGRTWDMRSREFVTQIVGSRGSWANDESSWGSYKAVDWNQGVGQASFHGHVGNHGRMGVWDPFVRDDRQHPLMRRIAREGQYSRPEHGPLLQIPHLERRQMGNVPGEWSHASTLRWSGVYENGVATHDFESGRSWGNRRHEEHGQRQANYDRAYRGLKY